MDRQSSRPFLRKLKRLRSGEAPRVLDLFSGCGGLTLGFQRAGYVPLAGVEIDPHAAASYGYNFHAGPRQQDFARPRDIVATHPLGLLSELGVGDQSTVDVIIGGPPCPAFTRVGRAKLREVYGHPEAFRHDPRSTLYRPYLEYVRSLQPLAVVMENVPDMLNWGGHNLGEEVAEVLEGLNYDVAYTLLNAAAYGVPQTRERCILVALHKSVHLKPRFPVPTRQVDLPRGYIGSRRVALRTIQRDGLFNDGCRYVPPPEPPPGAPLAVTALEALADLPKITDHLRGEVRRGAKRLDTPVPYAEPLNSPGFVRLMRDWPSFRGNGHLFDHVTRALGERDYRIFRHMKPGNDYPAAVAIAERLFARWSERGGHDLRVGSAAWKDARARFVPPYSPDKFPNKWRKLEPDKPARTLMAHLGKDTYSHIHFDSAQARTITVREAARLQSFPDGFIFKGTMNAAFRQIGNSVPPLLAFAVASELMLQLRGDPAGFSKHNCFALTK